MHMGPRFRGDDEEARNADDEEARSADDEEARNATAESRTRGTRVTAADTGCFDPEQTFPRRYVQPVTGMPEPGHSQSAKNLPISVPGTVGRSDEHRRNIDFG